MKNAGMRAFSLIEIITVISILMIVVGFMMRGGSPAKETLALERAANDIANLFRTARQNSLTAAEYGGVHPSYGILVSPGSVDGANSSRVIQYAVETIDADNSGIRERDICYASGASDNFTISDYRPQGGVYIESITVAHKRTTGGGRNTYTAANLVDAMVIFTRPQGTSYLVVQGSDTTERIDCNAGSKPFGTFDLNVLLRSPSGHARTVTLNSVGAVQVRVP